MTKELKRQWIMLWINIKLYPMKKSRKERENVLKMENSWNSQINCLLPKLETDLNNNNKFHHDCQTNLQKFINNNDICERINKFQQDNNSQLDKINPFDLKPKLTSSINGITNDIQQYHNQMNNNLTKINQELTQIQQFDANTMKISPIKESSRIPITTANMPIINLNQLNYIEVILLVVVVMLLRANLLHLQEYQHYKDQKVMFLKIYRNKILPRPIIIKEKNITNNGQFIMI